MSSPSAESADLIEFNRVKVNKLELLHAVRYTCVGFFSFYLQDELTMEVPELHDEIWTEILDYLEQANQFDLKGLKYNLQKLFAVPRGHAKSTIAKLAVILFLKFSNLSFVVYASKTNSIAKNAIRDIIAWMSSPQEIELYGQPTVEKSSESESLWILVIKTRDPKSGELKNKRVIFKALGADQQIRGTLIDNKRPQIAVVDDIEDYDNTKTPEAQANLDEWFMGAFMKALDGRRTVVLYLGNLIRKTTLLARFIKDPEWNPTVFGSLVKTKDGGLRPLWPGLHSAESLLTEYAKYRRLGIGHVWEAEMMNLTQDAITDISFKHAVIVKEIDPEEVECGFLTLDPAYADGSNHDNTAISVHVKVKGYGIPIVVDKWTGKAKEDDIFEEMVNLSYTWGLTTWLIESDAAQRLFIAYFQLLMQTRKMNPGTFQMLPISTGKKAKAARIMTFKNSVASGNYGYVESLVNTVQRLSEYTASDNKLDDELDSDAYGLKGWAFYGETVRAQGVQQVALLAQSAWESGGALQEAEICAF